MNNYIATFFSHYDALTFFNFLQQQKIAAKLMPVPRKVSSSCGTCVSFAADAKIDVPGCEVDEIYLEDGEGFLRV